MSYLLKNSGGGFTRRGSIVRRISPATLSIFLAAFILIWIFHSFFSGVVFTIGKPVLFIRASIADRISFVGNFIKSQSTLAEENQKLKDSLAISDARSEAFEALRADNENLKKLSATTKAGVIGRVIVSPGVSPFDTFVIDIGSDQGVVLGGEVRITDNRLVGFVTKVFSSSALVTLLSSPTESLAVRIGEKTVSTAYGRGAGNFIITIPKDAAGDVGDAVFARLYGETIGVVGAVETGEADSMKNLFVSFPFSVGLIDFVAVYPPNHAYDKNILLDSASSSTSSKK